MFKTISLIGAVTLPLWNIPLIARIVRRKSSDDISMAWAAGVWACIVMMLPSYLFSEDRVLKFFGVFNTVAFTAVFFVVLKYRKNSSS